MIWLLHLAAVLFMPVALIVTIGLHLVLNRMPPIERTPEQEEEARARGAFMAESIIGAVLAIVVLSAIIG